MSGIQRTDAGRLWEGVWRSAQVILKSNHMEKYGFYILKLDPGYSLLLSTTELVIQLRMNHLQEFP